MSNLSISSRDPSHSHSRSQSVLDLGNVGGTSSPKKKQSHQKSKSITKPFIIHPSLSEQSFGDSIGKRTSSLPNFKELGPPDLIHISNYNKISQKEEGNYHYITGLDVSSPVAPLAYLTTLNLNSSNNSSKHPNIYTYCSFNSFSRCDVRIRIEFPNNNNSSYQLQQIPSDRSNKTLMEVNDDVWEELFVSSVIRSVIINLDFERKLPSLVEKPLIKSIQHSKTIISKLIKFLDKGYLLGCISTVQRPSLVQNFLVDTLLKIVELTNLYDYTIELLTKHKKTDQLTILIIKILFLKDSEVEAIKLINQSLKLNPRDTLILNEQVKFLLSREQYELALNPALSAVNSNPVDFESWLNLTKLHILSDNIPMALVALNSAPMYTIRSKDLIFIENKDSLALPFPNEGKIHKVWGNISQIHGLGSENLIKFSPRYEVEACDPTLIRINQTPLKGTYKLTYDLLILIINKIGWDNLLKIRSQVFIMDDEYKKTISTTSIDEKNGGSNSSITNKRLCERWLDQLFLVLYEDLRVVLIVENELNNAKQLKHSGLEWQLIGLASFRTQHFKNSIAALRTSLSAKFDIISALKVMELWENQYYNRDFKIWNKLNKFGNFDITLDQILDILVRAISFNIRFFNEFQLDILLFLKKFLTKYDVDFIKNKIQVLFENDNKDYKNSGVIPPFDSLVADTLMFSQ
ncbi:hypothetical protein BN7_6029 [Wickerhamomyces ciferrii]|uniref:Uncharacterized protein n=1 Tax=Wickerhamomyces ciferrii (strain ATCC 14091 / BCRC 22168 / CBS 111 / JCM 3599 / NBRC 0793 / NRRL Y-1031 F-60-10) TaxID=1206466 RepID=K0KMD6_WICCF|nr:uncharacterized protein BN7_6029 [Wickerhamomyces ciferrii]CCH46435.1 hypothetical protein BN7_6029 [Wickerhamomyces ciferrii]